MVAYKIYIYIYIYIYKASTKLILGKPLNCHHLDYQQFQARKILASPANAKNSQSLVLRSRFVIRQCSTQLMKGSSQLENIIFLFHACKAIRYLIL
jgi:hypothetical protein